jgi:mannose-6-phosphate isomerase-like protein (cupin superfamily)
MRSRLERDVRIATRSLVGVLSTRDALGKQRDGEVAVAKDSTTVSLRTVDHAAREAKGLENRYEQDLIDALTGGTNTMVRYVDTPPGGGSPAGMHVHVFDQLFYIISGTMNIEIDGDRFEAGPGSLVVFPEGVPHRNWNEGAEPTIHLAINSPLPDPTKPFSISV